MKSDAIQRWLQDVQDDGEVEVPRRYDDRGGSYDRDHAASSKRQMLSYSEWERKRDRQETAHADAADTTFLASRPNRHGSVKTKQRPSTASSSRPKATLEVFERTDHTGRKVSATEERDLYLDKAEKVDPSGQSTHSNCPTVTGRSRALSRSNAVRHPTSSMGGTRDYHRDDRASSTQAKCANGGRSRALSRSNAVHRPHTPILCDNPDHRRDYTVVSRPSEISRTVRPRVPRLGDNSYCPTSIPSASHTSEGLRPGASRGANTDNSSHVSGATPKLRRSKFQEDLRNL